jgi:hypothetical protein
MAFSTNRKLNIAYAHALSKVNMREDQAPYESSRLGGHNVQGDLVWGDVVPFASTTIEADNNVTNNPAKKLLPAIFQIIPNTKANIIYAITIFTPPYTSNTLFNTSML